MPWLMAAQIVPELPHCVDCFLMDFFAGLKPRAINLYLLLGRHFQQRFGHRTPAGIFDADEKDVHFGECCSDRFYKRLALTIRRESNNQPVRTPVGGASQRAERKKSQAPCVCKA